MTADIIPIGVTPKRPTPLADDMRSMAFSFRVQSGGVEATHIFLPRKSLRSEVKPFIEALCAEEPEIGKAPYVFDRIVNGEPGQCEFAGLLIEMYDGRDVIVGTKEMLDR